MLNVRVFLGVSHFRLLCIQKGRNKPLLPNPALLAKFVSENPSIMRQHAQTQLARSGFLRPSESIGRRRNSFLKIVTRAWSRQTPLAGPLTDCNLTKYGVLSRHGFNQINTPFRNYMLSRNSHILKSLNVLTKTPADCYLQPELGGSLNLPENESS